MYGPLQPRKPRQIVRCLRMLTHARSYLNPVLLRGGLFSRYFSGFAIDRSKKYIKTIENHMKIDAVNPQAAADNHPPTPGHNGQVYGTLQPSKPRQIVRCLRMLTHARSYLNPLNPLSGISFVLFTWRAPASWLASFAQRS